MPAKSALRAGVDYDKETFVFVSQGIMCCACSSEKIIFPFPAWMLLIF